MTIFQDSIILRTNAHVIPRQTLIYFQPNWWSDKSSTWELDTLKFKRKFFIYELLQIAQLLFDMASFLEVEHSISRERSILHLNMKRDVIHFPNWKMPNSRNTRS